MKIRINMCIKRAENVLLMPVIVSYKSEVSETTNGILPDDIDLFLIG